MRAIKKFPGNYDSAKRITTLSSNVRHCFPPVELFCHVRVFHTRRLGLATGKQKRKKKKHFILKRDEVWSILWLKYFFSEYRKQGR